MAITITTAPHRANTIPPNGGASHAREILNVVAPCQDPSINAKRTVIHSSFGADLPPVLHPSPNGFVHAVISAFNNHHHLTIRPDDIWLAIVTQLSFFMHQMERKVHTPSTTTTTSPSQSAELSQAPRGAAITASKRKNTLVARYRVGDRFSLDFANFPEDIALTINATGQRSLPEFRAWLTPSFSTATRDDVVAALAVMMGTLQARFQYACWFRCGIPSVTVLGEKQDYEDILARVQTIKNGGYGGEAMEFGHMVSVVLSGFLLTFEDPEGDESRSFMRQMIWNAGRGFEGNDCVGDAGDGATPEKRGWYNGWITTFCYWDETGTVQLRWGEETGFPEMNGMSVPGGFTRVPIALEDREGIVEAELLGGSVGILCSSSRTISAETDDEGNPVIGLDTVQPQIGWVMYEEGIDEAAQGLVDPAPEGVTRVFHVDRDSSQ